MATLTLPVIFKSISVIFSLAAISTGLHALLNPTSFASSFGIPIPSTPSTTPTSPPPPAYSYISLLGARQLGTGITLLIFAYQGKWAESATILCVIGVLVAGMDGWCIARHGSVGGGLFHAGPGLGIAGVAGWVLWGGEL